MADMSKEVSAVPIPSPSQVSRTSVPAGEEGDGRVPFPSGITLGQIEAWILDPSRTLEELYEVSGLVKIRCEDSCFAGQTRAAFEDVSREADTLAKAKFPG